MTDNTKMREAFEKWNNGPGSLTFYSYWQAAWQAAQSEQATELERLRKDAEIGAAIQRAAKDLPDGFDIFMQVENGSASVQLYREDTNDCMDMDVDADNRLAAEIHAAIDAAIAGA